MSACVINVPKEFVPTFEGIYTFVAHKVNAAGDIVNSRVLAGPFNNVITDQGLNRMGANDFYIGRCQVGSGNATPSTSDTGLQTWVAGTTTIHSNSRGAQNSPPYYAYDINTYRFGVGVAAGNLSEVGVGWNTSGATLYSRALILDGSGNPTTITVLPDEILDVVYEFRVYPPLDDVVGTINISGDTYNYTLRAAHVTSHQTNVGPGWGCANAQGLAGGLGWAGEARSGAIGPITGSPSGTSYPTTIRFSPAYVDNSLERDLQYQWDVTRNGPFRSIMFASAWGTYQIEFDPVIPKTLINVFTITFTHSWARAVIP